MEPDVSLAVDLGLRGDLAQGGRGGAGLTAARSVPVPGLARRIEVKIAATRDEFEQAFGLLARKYQERGYDEPSPKLFRFTPYHVLPDTVTCVAKHGGAVVATLSQVPDTALLGLPLECIYGPEVTRLRREGRRLAEVTSLAEQDLLPGEILRVLPALLRLAFQHHVSRGEGWVIAIHPRHGIYYRKALGLAPLGPRRSHPAVQGHPAEAYLLDAGLMQANVPAMHQEFFGAALPEAAVMAPGRPADHVRHFADHSTQADRRTILEILHQVERLGGRPRWHEPGRVAA